MLVLGIGYDCCITLSFQSIISKYYNVTHEVLIHTTEHVPSEVMFSLKFLVAFKSSFLKFLQTHREASPLSDIMHSLNSSSLKAGCNTYIRTHETALELRLYYRKIHCLTCEFHVKFHVEFTSLAMSFS